MTTKTVRKGKGRKATPLGKSMRRGSTRATTGIGRRIWRKVLRALVAGARDLRDEIERTRRPAGGAGAKAPAGSAGRGASGGARSAPKGAGPLQRAQRAQGGQRRSVPRGAGGAGGAGGHPQPPDDFRDWNAAAEADGWTADAAPADRLDDAMPAWRRHAMPDPAAWDPTQGSPAGDDADQGEALDDADQGDDQGATGGPS